MTNRPLTIVFRWMGCPALLFRETWPANLRCFRAVILDIPGGAVAIEIRGHDGAPYIDLIR
jgi:hypothetical protein